MQRTLRLALTLLCCAAADRAVAVEKGQIGIGIETGTRRLIGCTYHAGDRLALRPAFTFQRVEAENTPTLLDLEEPPFVYETKDTTVGGQIEVDYFIHPKRRLAPYVLTTAAFSNLNTPYVVSQPSTTLLRNGNLRSWSVGAGFGAQYAIAHAFHVFGHVDLAYTSGERFTLDGQKLHSHMWATSTSALGIVLYLK